MSNATADQQVRAFCSSLPDTRLTELEKLLRLIEAANLMAAQGVPPEPMWAEVRRQFEQFMLLCESRP
jgi:hypothetical protein